MALHITPGGSTAVYTHHGDPVYLNADKSAVVPGDSPEAAFLLVADGGTLPSAEAERYGLTKDATKAAPAKANKSKSAPENK